MDLGSADAVGVHDPRVKASLEFVYTMIILMGLMLATVLAVAVGEKYKLPWPVLLTAVGAAAAFLPVDVHLDIEPELILPIFLPPLLWALARKASWGMFRFKWRTMLNLSVLLVFVTIAAVTGTLMWMVPGLGFAAAMAIAAAIAPPDPVAVDAVAEPAGIPRRITGTLQTEGLFNDAASLVAFSVALTSLPLGTDVDWYEALGQFVYMAIAAGVLGFLIGRLSAILLRAVHSATARNALTWTLPFIAYVGAEEIYASGVIAVVVAAVELTSNTRAEAAEDRVSGASFWSVVELLITGVAFGLIGMNVRAALEHSEVNPWQAMVWGTVASAVAILVRLVWIAMTMKLNQRKGREFAAPSRWKDVVILTWSGMRGLVTLALILSLPLDFPYRHEWALVALTVLFWTMVVPGLTVIPLMKILKRGGDLEEPMDQATEKAIDDSYQAAMDSMREAAKGLPEDVVVAVKERLGELKGIAGLSENPDGADLDKFRNQMGQMRYDALLAAQNSLASSRQETGVDPSYIDERMAEIDLKILALRR